MSGPEGHRYEYMYLGPNGNPAHWVAEDEAPVEESQPDDSSAPMEEPSSSSRLEPKEPDHPPPGFAGDADDDKVEVSATMPWNFFLASDADYLVWEGYSKREWQSWTPMQHAIKSSKKSRRGGVRYDVQIEEVRVIDDFNRGSREIEENAVLVGLECRDCCGGFIDHDFRINQVLP